MNISSTLRKSQPTIKTFPFSKAGITRLGADLCAKFMSCYRFSGMNDPDIQDRLIEQMNAKLTSGEAYYQLQPRDYINILEFLS